jgi:hypothetical protein
MCHRMHRKDLESVTPFSRQGLVSTLHLNWSPCKDTALASMRDTSMGRDPLRWGH